jgi:heme-degrading monooxygenase HmoA
MTQNLTAEARTAVASATTGPVTLINSFTVPAGRDEAFHQLWTETSMYFRARPGFVSLRLHRAVTPDADYRWVNVARWESEADYLAAHATDEFRQLVTRDWIQQFPNVPCLYEEVEAVG